MKHLRPQLLAALLQLAPLTRVFQTQPGLPAQPVIAILRWIFGSAAVAGSMHGLSGATDITPTSPRMTNGIRFSVQLAVTAGSHGAATIFESPTNLPPGLGLSSRGVLSGTPTNSGTFQFRFFATSLDDNNRRRQGGLFTNVITVLSDTPPSIVNPPTNTVVQAGQDARLSVAFTGDLPIAIRWFREDIEVRNATNAVLVLTNVQPAAAGRYRVRLVNSLTTVFSEFVTLTVNSPNPPPSLTAQPVSLAAHVGETVRFGVGAAGDGLSFAWTRGEQGVGNNASELVLTNVTEGDGGTYGVRVSNAGGSTNSAGAVLTVLPRLRLDPPVRSGDSVQLRFTGVEGRPYRLESAVELNGTFSPVLDVLGRSTGAVMTLAPTNATRVFRVRTTN